MHEHDRDPADAGGLYMDRMPRASLEDEVVERLRERGALRGSYTTQPDQDELGGLSADNSELDGLGVGGGIFYRVADQYRINFDYAFRHFGVLGSVDVFSVTFGWQ